MTARRLIVPGAMPSRDANGRALPAKLRFYEPATAYSTPAVVYTTSALDVPHAWPVLSDGAGRFPAVWADSSDTFDVAYTDQTFDRVLGGPYADLSPLADAMVASADMATAEADAAAASAAAAAASAASAAASAAVAVEVGEAMGDLGTAVAEAQAAAVSAAASAAEADQFDPSLYVTRVAGLGGNVSADALTTALALTTADLTDFAAKEAALKALSIAFAIAL
jgi:hypothetical protein